MRNTRIMSDITRRRMLAGLGAGTTLLSSLLRRSTAQAATDGNFFLFATPNGFARDQFGGTGSGPGWQLAPSLKALEPWKKKLITIRGLSHKSSSTFNSHEDMCKVMNFVHGGGNKETVYAPSFDHDIGKVLGSRPLTLGVPPQAELVYTRVSWVGPNKADPKIYVPVQAYLAAFAEGTQGPSPSQDAARLLLARKKTAVDLVAREATTFCGRLTGADRENCEIYLDNIHQLGKRLTTRAEVQAPTCDMGGLQQRASTAGTSGSTIDKFRSTGESLAEIAAVALACGVRRVGSIIWQQDSAGLNPTNGGGGYNHHAVTHANDRPVWEQIDRWYADRFAAFIGKLNDLHALDRTIVVWASGISEEHNQCDECVVVAGGGELGLRTDQNVRYPWVGSPTRSIFQTVALTQARNPANKSLADLYVSIQKALGHNRESVGDTQYCTGGLKEVYAG